MPLSAEMIFLIALLFNIASLYLLRFAGKLRSGVDALLFCSILTGYFYGMKAGIVYGALVALAFYAVNWRLISYAFYVVPLNAASGALAAMLSGMPLVSAAFIALFFYHFVSFAVTFFFYRSAGAGYLLFTVLNFLTTYILLGFFAGFA